MLELDSESKNADAELKKREILKKFDNETGRTSKSNRREVLHDLSVAAGTIFTTILGFSGYSSAVETSRREVAKEAARKYNSSEKIQKATANHADDLIASLFDQGYLNDDTVSALPIEDKFDKLEPYSEATQGVFVFGTISNGNPRTNIQFKKQLSDNTELRIVVSPQKSQSYAVLVEELVTGTVLTSFTPTETENGTVTTQSCTCMDHNSDCYTYCNGLGSCSCAEITIGDYCTDDSGADCSYCTIDYSSCNSCSGTYSCP